MNKRMKLVVVLLVVVMAQLYFSYYYFLWGWLVRTGGWTLFTGPGDDIGYAPVLRDAAVFLASHSTNTSVIVNDVIHPSCLIWYTRGSIPRSRIIDATKLPDSAVVDLISRGLLPWDTEDVFYVLWETSVKQSLAQFKPTVTLTQQGKPSILIYWLRPFIVSSEVTVSNQNLTSWQIFAGFCNLSFIDTELQSELMVRTSLLKPYFSQVGHRFTMTKSITDGFLQFWYKSNDPGKEQRIYLFSQNGELAYVRMPYTGRLQLVKIPLIAFASGNSGLDLNEIREIRFAFDGAAGDFFCFSSLMHIVVVWK